MITNINNYDDFGLLIKLKVKHIEYLISELSISDKCIYLRVTSSYDGNQQNQLQIFFNITSDGTMILIENPFIYYELYIDLTTHLLLKLL